MSTTLKWNTHVVRGTSTFPVWSVTCRSVGVFAAASGEQLIVYDAESSQLAVCKPRGVDYVKVAPRERPLAVVASSDLLYLFSGASVCAIRLCDGELVLERPVSKCTYAASAGPGLVVVGTATGNRVLISLKTLDSIGKIEFADSYHWIRSQHKLCSLTWSEYGYVEVTLRRVSCELQTMTRAQTTLVFTGGLMLPGAQFVGDYLRVESDGGFWYSFSLSGYAWPFLRSLTSRFIRRRNKSEPSPEWTPVAGLGCSIAAVPGQNRFVLSNTNDERLDFGQFGEGRGGPFRFDDITNDAMALRPNLARVFVATDTGLGGSRSQPVRCGSNRPSDHAES